MQAQEYKDPVMRSARAAYYYLTIYSEERSGEMNKSKRSAPIALLAIACEEVLVQQSRSDRHSLINIIDRLEADQFPVRIPQMCFYMRFAIYDGGEFSYKVEVWDQENKQLDIPDQKGSLTDVAAHYNAIVRVTDFSLAGEGQHWIKVFVNGEESIRVPFNVIKIERGRGSAPAGDDAARTDKRRRERPARGKGYEGSSDEAYLIH